MQNIHIKDCVSKNIHFIGIGGISMSGIAHILLYMGCNISGSDERVSSTTENLKEKGVKIYYGHHKENVNGADLVVHTAAVKDSNVEIATAKELGIPVIDRASLLGQIMRNYKYSIGVAGTHGKTTTTSMLSIIMQNARLDPTILLGGNLDAIGGNVRVGKSDYFLTEACEYVESFLKFYPNIAVITNIDKDHLDYYKDLDQIFDAFKKYASLVPKDGYLIGCSDNTLVKEILDNSNCNTISYGIYDKADLMAVDIEYDHDGCPSFNVVYNDKDLGRFMLNIQGEHNIYNSLAAICTSLALGIKRDTISKSLLEFSGTHRRFEVKGKTDKGFMVIDDYAHHPTEVEACLSAAKKYPHQRIWCVFQPHTYTRTEALLDEFSTAFGDADKVIIADIYAAREKDNGSIHSKDLARAIKDNEVDCIYLPSFEEIKKYLIEHVNPDDVVITMGAGDISSLSDELINTK